MADKPLFIAGWRDELFRLKPSLCNTPQVAFTPGPNGSRLHAIAVASDYEAAMTVEFGFAEKLSGAVVLTLAPGAAPATDPFTLTRASGSFTTDGWTKREMVVLGTSFVVANRGEYRIEAITTTVLTLTNPGLTPTLEVNVTADLWRWAPLWSMEVPLRCGYDGVAAASALDPGQMPWLDATGDRWLVLKRPLWVRNAGNRAGGQGGTAIVFHGGDY